MKNNIKMMDQAWYSTSGKGYESTSGRLRKARRHNGYKKRVK